MNGAGERLSGARAAGLAAAVAVVAFATYATTLSAGLVWDDPHHVKQNVMIRSFAHLPEMLTTDQWAGDPNDPTITPYYRPLYKVSFAIDYALWGERPFGYHLTNVLLHAVASALVLLVGLELLGGVPAALISGLVFAVHPVHSEAVAWISARNELLCGVFLAAALLLHERWRRRGGRARLALALGAFFLSLLGKEMSITLPALVLLREAIDPAVGWPRRLRVAGAYLAVAVAYLALRAAVLDVLAWRAGAPLWQRLLTAPDIAIRYARLLVLPTDLRILHAVPLQESPLAAAFLLPLLGVLALAAATGLAWRWDRRVSFAAAWIPVTLFPVSGIPTAIGPTFVAERYLYVPSVGFSLLAGTLAARALARAPALAVAGPARHASRGAVGAAIAAWIAWLGIATHQRNAIWASERSFSLNWVREFPTDATGHLDLGVVYEQEGDLAAAEAEYLLAQRLAPDAPDPYAALGVLYDKLGRPAAAAAAYQRALALAPRSPDVLYNLGVHHLLGERYEAAREAFQQVIEVDPAYRDAHYNLGLLHERAGDPARALRLLERAAELDPGNADVRAALERVRSGVAGGAPGAKAR